MKQSLFGKISNKFYSFCSEPKTKFYFHLIYGILAIHLSVYAVALARYEFALFTLDTKISNLITLSEGKNPKVAFETIASLSNKLIPVEPIIYNILSSIESLLPWFDGYNVEAQKELSRLLAYHKANLNGLDLEGFIFVGKTEFKNGADFRYSSFNDIGLVKATLKDNIFQYSDFFAVDFSEAKMNNTDFAFSTFEGCALHMANFESSNLCGVNFVNIKLGILNLSYANLVGADLSGFLFHPTESLANLNGAYYNSDPVKWYKEKQMKFIKRFPSCEDAFPFTPTKFPEGFDPEAHGMIDISKW